MRKHLLFWFIVMVSSTTLMGQWAKNKNAREDAIYARVMQGSESVTVDGVEDAVWAKADSVVVGYGQTKYLPSSGYNLQAGISMPGDSANAVFKCLYKAPYMYVLFKVVDKSVGGRDWEQSDAIIMSFKQYPAKHYWTQAWDNRVEHFYTYGWLWAGDSTAPIVGGQPSFKGNDAVAGGQNWKRTANQKERWTAFTKVLGGTSNDTLPDQGYISEHRIRIDSLGYNMTGKIVLPFSFSIFDGDNFLDSNKTNNAHTKTWWGCEWNENWFYSALMIDPSVTTASAGGQVPKADYVIPHLRSGEAITMDGDLADWKQNNVLSFRTKYGDDAAFDKIAGTGAWASGYTEADWNKFPTVVDGPEMDCYVTYDDANLYVGAKVTDQIVTMPGEGGRKDGITFFMVPRTYNPGIGIFPAKALTVNIDSTGKAQAGDDLIRMADTAGVVYKLKLGTGTIVNNHQQIDSGYTVELKIPFAAFNYPANLGDSVVFIGARVNDIDEFDDKNSNYYASAWWFKQDVGQHGPAWIALGPAQPLVSVNDKKPVPTSIELYANYPNPFNPVTTIKYSVNKTSDVTLYVYDMLGQVVSVVKQANAQAGTNEFKFSAASLASGVYFYQIKVNDHSGAKTIDSRVNKMIVLK
ncbi:MAG: T9SS type A sorting domain-containing protein [Syntrophothermus sp.]